MVAAAENNQHPLRLKNRAARKDVPRLDRVRQRPARDINDICRWIKEFNKLILCDRTNTVGIRVAQKSRRRIRENLVNHNKRLRLPLRDENAQTRQTQPTQQTQRTQQTNSTLLPSHRDPPFPSTSLGTPSRGTLSLSKGLQSYRSENPPLNEPPDSADALAISLKHKELQIKSLLAGIPEFR